MKLFVAAVSLLGGLLPALANPVIDLMGTGSLIPRQATSPKDLPTDDPMRPGTFSENQTLADRLHILKTIGDGGEGDPTSGAGIWVSPVYTDLFQNPLQVQTPLLPIMTFTNETTGEVVDYFEITVTPTFLQIYKDLNATMFEGYNGVIPGPLFDMPMGRHSVVRFINNVSTPISIHLHGSPSRPPWDGYAADTTEPGQFKDYFYPNESPRSLWYHDHALGITARNAYFGQAGLYIVRNTSQDEAFDLPRGKYEIYIQLNDKKFQPDGQLISPAGETEMFYGDVIFANGVPWPFWVVEPRKYRIRFNAAAINRTFKLRVETADGTVVPFHVIGTDGGLSDAPVPTEDLIIAIAERYEIVVDFTGFENQTLFLRNARQFSVNPDFAFTDYVMSFNITDTVTDQTGNGPLPAAFDPLPFAPDDGQIDRTFRFERQNGDWRINGVGWDDPLNPPIIADPPETGNEVWELINSSGGWAHPVHIHLIDFKVLTRTQRGVEPYENGFKDVVFTAENEVVTVVARYAPWTGVYMFHCHNLIHEDNDMMGVFDVNNTDAIHSATTIPANGDLFSNPLQPIFRSADMTAEIATTAAIMSKLSFFTTLNAYVRRSGDDIIG
jgi:FtsP/CotA-like multicopper oxidase with cupredoxin domain